MQRELSLLSGMSEKERKKLHAKGIFTVTQLSYTFRPRRRHRESRGQREKYHHSLRALAIRENKIHVVVIQDPKLDGTPVYLDVEGLPDRDFYYLIGVRVGTGDGGVQHSFWADNPDEENRIWNEFLGVLSAIPNPWLIHYGKYETVFLKRMQERYGGPCEDSAAATAIKNAANLVSFVFAQVYFPTSIKWIEGHRWISRIPTVWLAWVRARSNRLATLLGSIARQLPSGRLLLLWDECDSAAKRFKYRRTIHNFDLPNSCRDRRRWAGSSQQPRSA
jgi:predicted RecB family nuclease